VPRRRRDFDRVAPFYEGLARLYTGGGIARIKLSQIHEMPARSRVLYAGGGAGEDALAAAQAGHRVTLIDSSLEMTRRAVKRARSERRDLEVICKDLQEHRRFDHYDVVAANFFLNVFETKSMCRMLAHLTRLLRPQGMIFIADFAEPKGRWLEPLMQQIYYGIPLLFFVALSGNDWHSIHDYRPALHEAGCGEMHRRTMRIFRRGPKWLATYSAKRVA